MKSLILFLMGYSALAWAILPLPYPDEPWDTDELIQVTEKPDPRNIQGYSELYSGGQLREMELPRFENPSGTLGYIEGYTFRVPPELQSRVDFWKRIYTQYTSSQSVLHDTKNLSIVYGVVDTSHIENQRLSRRRVRRMVNRHLRDEKKKIVRNLLTLDGLHDRPLSIPMLLLPIFKQFVHLDSRDKFMRAVPYVRSQIGQKDRIVKGFLYGGRYFPEMMEIFESYGVPKELTRLTLVESGFDINARSKVGASGVWQFMRSTGKRYLRIDRAVDERNDPILATHAAAKLLRKNFEVLGSWPLAVTAYNHGRAGMATAVQELGTKDLAAIIEGFKSDTFGFASSNFYASFLAILEVERDYRKYFGKLLVDSPIEIGKASLPREAAFTDVAFACHMKENDLEQFNPALTRWVTSGRGKIPAGYELKVPIENLDRCVSGFLNI
ncbi:MAG: lytic transglycosylase domain-containing protein [Bdellovibrionales bacterium]|nr:lytic transglycosylase domain-containing protein [Bdellovibrionales bacterium]